MSFVIILLVLLVFMYLLLIRPQRRQQKKHEELLSGLKIGDEIITAGGIYGDVSEIEDDRVHVLIAEDVEIEVARRSIATIVEPEPELELVDETEEFDEYAATEVEEPESADDGRRSSA